MAHCIQCGQGRITGGGLDMFKPPTFRRYAPDPENVHDVHSIYFEVMGETGFIGFALCMLLGLLTWWKANGVIKRCKKNPEQKWAVDLAAMVQVSMVGFATGGAFLGLAWFDLYYDLIAMVVILHSVPRDKRCPMWHGQQGPAHPWRGSPATTQNLTGSHDGHWFPNHRQRNPDAL